MTKICEWCGSEFEQTHGNQKYCTRHCHSLANKEFNRKRFGYYKNHQPRPCPECGKMFTPKHGKQKYCSDRCKFLAAKERYKPAEHKTVRCSCCGKPFVQKHGNQKYCSNECHKESLRRHLTLADQCCIRHGGIDNCPYPDCVME